MAGYFFCEEDYVFYPSLLKECCDSENIEIWVIPNDKSCIFDFKLSDNSNLSKAISETHRSYTQMINFFSSYPMDYEH